MGGWLESTKGILPDYVVYGFPLGKAKGSNEERNKHGELSHTPYQNGRTDARQDVLVTFPVLDNRMHGRGGRRVSVGFLFKD